MLWGASIAFVLLVVGLALLARGYWDTATDRHDATVTAIAGTPLKSPARKAQWVSAVADVALAEGDRLRTDEVAQAFVTLFDYSTLLVYSNTEVHLLRQRSSRFAPQQEEVELALEQGKVHVGVGPPLRGDKSFRLRTPHGVFDLEEGSYTLQVERGHTRLRVAERGQASIEVDGAAYTVVRGQRLAVAPGRVLGPVAANEELIYNGDFAQGFSGWLQGNILGFKEGTDVTGGVSLTVKDGRLAVRFLREGSKGTHNETYLYQEIDRDVSEFSELWLSLELQLVHQSLSGGGYLGSEYPVVIRVTYRSASGDSTAGYGFYYENFANNRTNDGVPVPQQVWLKYTAPTNFMTLAPPPKRILSVQVSASGWDYESLVANVALSAR
ncbi:MAG: FecR domain-containing protein [Chloroflexi bacterium]|nr:FecR domain-containing protein [Chloroflexota bacterium]